MQRTLSAFDLYVITHELQELKGSYIDKIYQLTKQEILIKINNKKTKQKENLYIKNGELISLTQKKFTTPQKATTFAMTLRKYLQNGTITTITQHEFDRIIHITITKKEGPYTLTIELIPNGNILLLQPDHTILLPLIRQQWAHRTITPKKTYQPPPPQQNPFTLTYQQFHTLLTTSTKDLVRTLATTLNLSGPYAEELCHQTQLNKNTKPTQLTTTQLQHLYQTLQTFLQPFKQKKFNPQLILQNNTPIDILPITFHTYQPYTTKPIPSFIRGLETFITQTTPQTHTTQKLQQKTDQFQRKLTKQIQTLQQYKKDIKQKKIEADTIYLNYQTCETLLQEITHLLKQKDKTETLKHIQQKPHVKTFNPTANELIITLNDPNQKPITISLDFRKTTAENAEHLYQTRKKLQEKIKGAQEAIQHTKKQLQETQQKHDEQETQQTQTIEKHYWFEQYRWFITSQGNLTIAGKDAKTNEKIVKKYLTDNDRYIHADIHGAPSCILKSSDITNNPLDITEQSLQQACIFAASYSRAWNKFAETNTYWVLPQQVSKTPESGEYLPKGAFIIRGKRNYQKCTLELAIGEITLNNNKKIMGGPTQALQKHSQKYAILQPGTTPKNQIAKKLARIFNISIDHINQILPPGPASITKTMGFTLK